jgi:hypothetical protein
LDSSALGAVVQAQHRFNRQGRTLSLVAPNGSAAAVMLDLSGLRSRLRYSCRAKRCARERFAGRRGADAEDGPQARRPPCSGTRPSRTC